MAHEAAGLLFAPPHPPVRLHPGSETVLGRSRECALPIPSRQASRRHAAVRFEEGTFRLRDLGSTNGTFVNGERLEGERVLAPGDRIAVGETVVTFCRVDAALDEAAAERGEGQTVLSAPSGAAAGEALRGELSQIPAFALLQMLEMGHKTGTLTVEAPDGKRRMAFREGRPVAAEAPGSQGFEAALDLVQTDSGRFDFEPGPPPAEESLETSVTEVLLEASRRLDEGDAATGAGEDDAKADAFS